MENQERMFGEGIARQELNLIFVIDNSGSMMGEKIGSVNNAIRDVMSIMPEIQEDTADAIIKVSALKFNDNAEWVHECPQTADVFKWKDLHATGVTNLSAAYDKLAKWLCKKEKGGHMPDIGGVAPIIILMTDGMPTSTDWKKRLAELKKRGWFKVALKYALSIGIDTDEAKDVLSAFTGNPETVLKVYTAEALRQVIKVIAVTASKVKSNSSNSGIGIEGKTNNEIAQNQIAEKIEDIEEVEW